MMFVKRRTLWVICIGVLGIGFLFSTVVHNDWHQSETVLSIIVPSHQHRSPPFLMKDSHDCPMRNISIMKKTAHFTRVGLLSYPGSGNTWTRHLIQQLTGYCTGTVYCDKFLNAHGFPGECVFPSHKSKGCIVYKSHINKPKDLKQFDKAVILIRNPYDAQRAYFNFMFGKETNSSGKNTAVLSSKKKQKKFPRDKFHALVDRSRYNSTKWETYVKKEACHWQSLYTVWLKTFANRSLLVRYVDLKENLIPTLRRISHFLNVTTSEADYTCTYVNKEGQHHRKQKYELGITDIFTEQHINIVNGAIINVMNASRYKYRLKDFIFVNPE